MSRRSSYLLLLSLVVLAACKDKQSAGAETSSAVDDEPEKAALQSFYGDDCGAADFPCSWGEVAPAIDARTDELAFAAMATMTAADRPDVAGAAAVLRAADDVAYVHENRNLLRFRVKGGRPAWIMVPVAADTLGGLTAVLPMQAVTVENPAGASKEGEKPFKNTLILSPFYWQWQLSKSKDLSDDLAKMFREHPRINGTNEVRKNQLSGDSVAFRVGYKDFQDWKNYDLIHVSTHGFQDCKLDEHGKPSSKATDCMTGLLSGDVYTDDFEGRAQQGIEKGYFPTNADWLEDYSVLMPWSPEVGPALPSKVPGVVIQQFRTGQIGVGPFVMLTTRFFARAYPRKLDDKIIVLSACQSAQGDDLITALAGKKTAVVGWDRSATVELAALYSKFFWRFLLQGKSIDESFDEIKKLASGGSFAPRMAHGGTVKAVIGSSGNLIDPGTSGEMTPSGETATRAIEIVSLHDPGSGDELVDRGALPIEGAAGDGQPDSLSLIFRVIGVGDDEKGTEFAGALRFGKSGGVERDLPARMTPSREIAEGVWQVEAVVQLGEDLDPDATYNLEPSVKLPGGGVSRWRYENLGFSFFRITVDGPQVEGQTFSLPVDQVKVRLFGDNGRLDFTPPESDRPRSRDGSGVMLLSVTFPGNEPKSYSLGRAGGGAQVRLQIEASAAAPRCPLENGCRGVGLKPGAGTVTLTQFEQGKVAWDPKSSGTSKVAGSFDVTLQRTTVGLKEEQYRVRGEFLLSGK